MDLNDIENRSQNHVNHSSKFHYLCKYIEQFKISDSTKSYYLILNVLSQNLSSLCKQVNKK